MDTSGQSIGSDHVVTDAPSGNSTLTPKTPVTTPGWSGLAHGLALANDKDLMTLLAQTLIELDIRLRGKGGGVEISDCGNYTEIKLHGGKYDVTTGVVSIAAVEYVR